MDSHLSLVPPDATPSTATPALYQPTTLALPESIGFAEWGQIGGSLSTMEQAINWWIGDWLNFGERRFGEDYAQAVQETGRDAESLSNIAAVARRIEPARRRENLSWSHHRAVAYLEVGDQERLLERADRERWSKRSMEEAVRSLKHEIRALPPRGGSTAPAPEPASTPLALVDDDDKMDEREFLAEIERAEAERAALEEENGRLKLALESTDRGRDILALEQRYSQLEARVHQLVTESNEAKQDARRRGKLLRQIREALGVERDSEILGKLRRAA